MKRGARARVVAAAMVGLFGGGAAALASTQWDNGASNGSWSTATNWDTNVEPGPGTPVLFPSSLSGSTITLSSGEDCLSLSFSGDYTLNSGSLDIAFGDVTVASGNAATINSILGGTQGLQKMGDGTLTLGGVNTFTGTVSLDAGTLSIGSDTRLGDSDNAVTFNGGTLLSSSSISSARGVTLNSGGGTIQTNSSLTLSGVIGGTGGLTKTGSSTLYLTGADMFAGAITISAGTLSVGHGGTSGSVTANITNDAVLNFNRSNTSTYAGVITGIGDVNKYGTGTLILSGTSSTFQDLNVNRGMMQTASGHDIAVATLDVGTSTDPADTDGTLIMDGSTSALTVSGLTQLGRNGRTGTLIVQNGADATFSGDLRLAQSMSMSSTGIMTVQTSGDVTATNVMIGTGGVSGQSGDLTVTGLGSTFVQTGAATLTLGNVNSGSPGTLTIGTSATYTTGTGPVLIFGGGSSITVSGGTFNMLGDLEVYGAMTVSSGTMNIGNGGTTGTVYGNISNNGNVTFNRSNNYDYSDVISGTGSLTKLGAGMLTLSNNNTYTGVTTISAGTLQVGFGGGSGSIAGNVVNNANLIFNHSIAVTYAGSISGTGSVTKTGTGTLRLANTSANTYSGTTTINQGTLELASAVSNGAIAGNVVIGDGVGGTGADVVRLFANEQIANTANITINSSGLLAFNGFSEEANDLVFNGSTLDLGGGQLKLRGNVTSLANSVTSSIVGSPGSLKLVDAANGGLATHTFNIADGAASPDFTVTVPISDLASACNLTKTGAGLMRLGAANTYGGTTTISAGTLQTSSNNAVPATSALTVSSGAVFDVNGFTDTIGSLAGAGNVTLGSGALTAGVNSTSTNYSGTMSGSGSFTKAGSGTLTLGAANTYTGATTISAGTLLLNATNGLSSSTAVTVSSGATFNLNGFSDTIGSLAGAGNVVLGSGALTAGGNNTSTAYTGVMSGSGSFTKTGAGTLTLANANTYSGGTTINAGTVAISQDANLGNTLGVVNVNGGTLLFTASFFSANSRFIQLNSGAVSVASGVNVTVASLHNNGGTLIVGTGATLHITSPSTLLLGGGTTIVSVDSTVNTASLQVSSNDNRVEANGRLNVTGQTFFSTGVMPGIVVKAQGASIGEVTFSSDVTVESAVTSAFLSGPVVGSAGRVNLGGSTEVSPRIFNVIDGPGAVDLAISIPVTNGAVRKNGSGVMALTAASDYSAGTIIAAGTLEAHDNALGSGRVTMSGGRLNLRSAASDVAPAIYGNDVTFSGGIIDIDRKTVGGLTGTMRFDELSMASGISLSVQGSNGGTLEFTGPVTLNGNASATAHISTFPTVVLSGVISGDSKFDKDTLAGTLRLAGASANTYFGSTTVRAGTLELAKTAGVNAIGAGPGGASKTLTAITGGSVKWLANDQVDNVDTLTVSGSTSSMQLNGFNETVAGVTMTAGTLDTRQIANPNIAGTLTLAGNVSTNISSFQASIIGNLSMGGAMRTFNVADFVGTPPIDLLVSANISGGGGIRKTGAGTMALQGNNASFSGAIEVNDGTLLLGNTPRLSSLTITGSGKLDLVDDPLVIVAGDVGSWNGSEYTGITGLLQSGRNGFAWDGNGIVTSMTDATTTVLTTLAVSSAEAAFYDGGTFGGVSVNVGDVLVMYTWGGDANLDGTLTGDDYFRIDGNYLAQIPGYSNGDFNYDGEITGDDYFIIDSNYVYASNSAEFPTAGNVGLVSVPEPTTIAPLIVLAGLAVRKRRRRS